MGILHTINKSPFENNSLESCLSLLAPDSSILFIEDAVIAAMQNTRFSSLVQSKLEAFKVYALQPDLDARGLDGRLAGTLGCSPAAGERGAAPSCCEA